MSRRPVLPPRKKDWKPGTTQVGVFIRAPDGSTIELGLHDAPPRVLQPLGLVVAAILGIELPEPDKTRYERKDPVSED